MSTLVNSFDYLDQALDVGFKEVNHVLDNKVYSIRKDLEDSILNFTMPYMNDLRDLMGKVSSTISKVANMASKIQKELQNIWDKVIGNIMNLPFVGWGRDVVDYLKDISFPGIKGFLMDELSVGNLVLCNNLGTLQDLLDGYYIDPAVVEGLFMGLGLDWMNRVCKDFSREDEMRMTNKELLGNVIPYSGVVVDNNTVYNDFSGLFNGYYHAREEDPYAGQYGIDLDTLRSMIEDSDAENVMNLLEGSIDRVNKDIYVSNLDIIISEYAEDREKDQTNTFSDGELTALRVRGDVLRTDPFNREVILKESSKITSADAFGSYLKNLQEVDFKKVPRHNLTTEQKVVLDKIAMLKGITNTAEFKSRPHGYNSFTDFNFNGIKSMFDETDIETMKKEPIPDISHRFNDIHPTTEYFITGRKRQVVRKPNV